MAKRVVAFLVTLTAIAFVVVVYAMEHHAHASREPYVSVQAPKKSPPFKNKVASAAFRSNSSSHSLRGYSEKEYTFLRRHYKSPNPQAYGTLSAAGLKQLGLVMKHGVVAERHLLPVVNDVLYGKTSALEDELDEGMNPDDTVFIGYPYQSNVSLLDIAIRAGQRGIIKILLVHGASVNPPKLDTQKGAPYRFESPLVVAAEYGEDDVVRELLQHGANVNQRHGLGSDNSSALAEATYSGGPSTVYLLLTQGADINSVLGPGGTVPGAFAQPEQFMSPNVIALRNLLVKYGAKMPTN